MIDILPQGTKITNPERNPKNKAPANDARREAVLAAIHGLSDNPAAAYAGFEPGAVRDACDRTAFSSCTDNPGSFLKAVSRALEALVGERIPAVVKDGGRYRLVEQPPSPPASFEPNLFDLVLAAE